MLQIVLTGELFTVAVGFTVIVKVWVLPGQLFPAFEKVGVTVMVATTGTEPELVAKNAEISPVPLAAKPMLVVLFTQV